MEWKEKDRKERDGGRWTRGEGGPVDAMVHQREIVRGKNRIRFGQEAHGGRRGQGPFVS